MRTDRALSFLALLCAGLLASCGGGGSNSNSCHNSCSQGQTRCSGDQIQTCAADSNGCLAFGAATACQSGFSCSASSNSCQQIASGGGSWTVLVYVAADNTLEQESILNLQQMAQVGSSPDLNIVVEIDRGLQYSTAPIDNISWSAPSAKRLLVQNGGFQELADLGPIDSGTVQSLQDFVHFGITHYPAQHTALILWDHGGSWEGGFGYDDSQGSHFTVADVKQAISNGISGTAVSRFDLLGFDACLMGSFEVLDQLQALTQFYVASEETEPGAGWDYTSLQVLKSNPGTDPVALGHAIVDGFIAQNPDPTATLALIDTSKFANARAQVTAAAQQLQTDMPDQTTLIGKARASTLEFGRSSDPSQSFYVIDFGDLLNQLATQSGSFATLASQATAALQAAVIYERHGPAEQNAHGLTVYFPPDSKNYNATGYGSLPDMQDWRGFLGAFFSSASGIAPPKFASGATLSVTADASNKLVVEGALDPSTVPNIVSAQLLFGYSFPESSPGAGDDAVAFYGDRPATVTASNTAQASWDRSVLTLSDGTNMDFAYLSISQQGSSGVASIPLAYLPAGAADCSSSSVIFAIRVVAFDLSTGAIQSDTLYAFNGDALAELTPAAGSHLAAIVKEYIGSKQLTQQPTRSGWFCGTTQLNASPLPTIGFQTPNISAPTQQAFVMSIANAGGDGDALAAFGNY